MTLPEILFVDDDPNVLAGIRRALRGLSGHWSMLFANSGGEALEMLRRHEVAVVVTDISMPGMDGEVLIRRLFDDYPHLGVVVLSGVWTTRTSDNRVGAGIRFLSKPVAAETLVAAISQALQDLFLTVPDEYLPPLRWHADAEAGCDS